MPECTRARELHAYHDGELSLEERRTFEGHLAKCPRCARELVQIRSVSNLVAASSIPDIPPETLCRLHRRLDDAKENGILRLGEWLAAAALTLLLFSSALFWRMGTNGKPEDAFGQEWEKAAMTLRVEDAPFEEPELQLAQGLFADYPKEDNNE